MVGTSIFESGHVDGGSRLNGVLEVEDCDLDELNGLDGAASSVKS